MTTHNLSKEHGIVNVEIGTVLEITGNVIFVKLNDGPLIPVTVLSCEEGLGAPLVSRHFALPGRYVCAWLWPRGVDQGQTSV